MRRLVFITISFFLACAALGQSDVGEVSFANSGAPAAQETFRRGLALLHNFEYEDAGATFREAQAIDPTFTMAYWGEAMTHTHPIWFQQDLDAARAVLAKAHATTPKTERERDYLATLDVLYGEGTKHERDFKYAGAMAALHAKYPDDVDATAFYALALLGTAHEGRDFAIYMRSAALLEEVFPTHRRHPGVLHYLIHSYDDPIHAPLGLRAARLYGGVAPNAGHALHMTSHIFVAMGMWPEVIAANERAMAVVDQHRGMKHMGAMPCRHYANWLEYGYLQVKRVADAKRMLDGCRGADAKDEQNALSYAEMRARWIADGGAIADAPPQANVASAGARFTSAYAEAVAARKDAAALHEVQARLHALEPEVRTALDKRASSQPADRARVAVILIEVDALALLADGKRDDGLALLRKAADAEVAMPIEFGPPPVELPALELLANELLAAGRAKEAAEAYEKALARMPGRRLLREGLERTKARAN